MKLTETIIFVFVREIGRLYRSTVTTAARREYKKRRIDVERSCEVQFLNFEQPDRLCPSQLSVVRTSHRERPRNRWSGLIGDFLIFRRPSFAGPPSPPERNKNAYTGR